MAKTPLQEVIFEMIDQEIGQLFSEDVALDMSDDRRKEFRDTVMSNPPADNSKGQLKEEGILPDKPAPAPVPDPTNQNAPPPGDSTPVDASPDMGAPMDAGAPGGSTSDMGAAMGAGGAGPTGAPGSDSGSPDDPTEPDDGTGDDTGDMGDAGGLGGGFGGGGGGGDMGLDDSDSGDAGDAGPPEPEPTYDPFKDAKTPEDRLQVILDTAETIAATTQDPQKVLKAVKGLIQNGFAEPHKAATIIAQLFDTENPVLQQVSRRLALFIDGI